MTTHATASKQWVELDLQSLPVERKVRLRGLEVTRLDTFIDAAFAFVLTLLVISFDQIPSNFDEMIAAIKRIPGFFASFCVLMMFWLSHRQWSRRYGLESNRAVFLSLALIFMMLVYVYPLRMIFEAMFASISDGYFTSDFEIKDFTELRGMFLYYSIGSLIMTLLQCDLYRTALSNKGLLNLNQDEILATRISLVNWFALALFSLISIMLAIILPEGFVPLAGYVYFFIYPAWWLVPRLIHSRAETQKQV